MLDIIDQGYRETGCVDFAERRSRIGDEYPRVVADGVEYTMVKGGRWRSYSLESGDWPQLHPCWFLEALVTDCRAGREIAGGRLELELNPTIVEQGPGARPAWTDAVATLERDDHGRAARLTVRLSSAADDAWVESTVAFADFGAPCEAHPPAPEDTVTFDEWLELLKERPPDV